MIRLNQLSAGYGGEVVLDSLSAAFAPGRLTAIVGPGGSGKSTLLRAICDAPAEKEFWMRGEVDRGGADFAYLPQKRRGAARTLREALLARDPDTAPLRTVQEVWPAAPEAQALVTRWMESAEPPSSVSRLLDLTLAVAPPASVLLLDEPDAGADDQAITWMGRLLEGLRGTRTVLLVTHNLTLASRVADEVMLLVDGVVVEYRERREFFHAPREQRTRDYIRTGS